MASRGFTSCEVGHSLLVCSPLQPRVGRRHGQGSREEGAAVRQSPQRPLDTDQEGGEGKNMAVGVLGGGEGTANQEIQPLQERESGGVHHDRRISARFVGYTHCEWQGDEGIGFPGRDVGHWVNPVHRGWWRL